MAVLDPELTATQPPKVAAATGIDAIAHAVETAGSNRRNEISLRLSQQAWTLLESSFDEAMRDPANADARERMLLGAHLAGAAIENSMLGAAHSIANALTAVCGAVHGVAVGMILPHVVRFNAAPGRKPLHAILPDARALARRIEQMLDAGKLHAAWSSSAPPKAPFPNWPRLPRNSGRLRLIQGRSTKKSSLRFCAAR